METEGLLATPGEAAQYLRTTIGQLAQMRFRGTGPVFVQPTARGRVLYEWTALTRWATENSRSRTGA